MKARTTRRGRPARPSCDGRLTVPRAAAATHGHTRQLMDVASPRACPSASARLDVLDRPRSELRNLGSRDHKCFELPKACLYARRLVLDAEPPSALLRTMVRGVHVGWNLQSVASTGLLRMRNLSAGDPPPPPADDGNAYSHCIPLVWWPVWGYNIGEFFQNSVLGVAELLAAGVVDRESVLLAPEVGGWPLVDAQQRLLRAFSTHPIQTVAQMAPRATVKRCGGAHGGIGQPSPRCHSPPPPPRCFHRILVCRFRDVYDRQPPVAPWSAAQQIAASLLRRRPGRPPLPPVSMPAANGEYVVLFAGRTAAKNGARLLTNEAELLQTCNEWRPPRACVGEAVRRSRCERRNFGKRGLRWDVQAIRQADALVGTHGAALLHAIFMRRGGALIEVRPYGFDGAWPDQYHFAMARRENATHAFVIRTVDRTLCSPVPAANVSAWDARPLNIRVLPGALTLALAAAACTSGGAGVVAPPLAAGDRAAAAAERAAVAMLQQPATAPIDYAALDSVVIENGHRSSSL